MAMERADHHSEPILSEGLKKAVFSYGFFPFI